MILKIIYTTGVRFVKTQSVKIDEENKVLKFSNISNDLETINLNDKKIVEITLDGKMLYPKGQQSLIDFLLEQQKLLNYSQKELAKFLDISYPALNYIMNRKRVAGDKIMRQIARKFGLTLSEVREMREMENNIKEEWQRTLRRKINE